MTPDRCVPEGELSLHGRLLPASNATFVGEVQGVKVVYKPIAGERPLWDFPDGTLAARELAAYAVSQALGWDIVPPTVLREGPHGPGMVQLWCDVDESQAPVDIVPGGVVPDSCRHVFDGLDAHDQPVALVHEDTEALRRMALFDVVVNNADRKGGHVLAMPDGHRYGVDHGLTFHVEPKLRTVLWGWLGEALSRPEEEGLTRLVQRLESDPDLLAIPGLSPREAATTLRRARALLTAGEFPTPQSATYPLIPWPPF